MTKIIFRVAISCLIFWVVFPILLYLIGLEFNNSELEQSYILIRLWGVPTCILLTLFGTIKPEDKPNNHLSNIIATIIIAMVGFFFMIMSLFLGMCDWTDWTVLYTNKENKEIKIIKRKYGCGATDSGPPIVKNFKIREFTKYFILVKEINIETIDQTKWMKNEE